MPAEFHLVSNESGTAELKLTFPLRAPSDPIPPPSAPNAAPSSSGSKCLKKANKSRILRRERRAAERAASEKNDAERPAAEKNAAEVKTDDKKVESENAAAEKADTETAAYRMKGAPEDFEKATEKCSSENCLIGDNGSMASTSCIASSRCVNCEGVMSAVHQCEVAPTPPSIDLAPKVPTEQLPAPLPLCHYCCHRGSGENPVHYYLQCLCMDKKCSCRCYCSEEQLSHRKLFYPQGFSDGNPVDPSDRPGARTIAEARADHRPCGSEHCVKPV